MRWRRLTITLLGVGLLLLLLVYEFHRDPRYIPSPLVGEAAPKFDLELFDKQKVSLNDFRGKTVFITFWASWCVPCREEARSIEAAWNGYKESKNQSVVFLGINIQDEAKSALDFIKEFGISYPNGYDVNGHISVDYGVWGVPEAFFISPEGIITYKHVGAVPLAVLSNKIREAQTGRVTRESGEGTYQSIK